MRPNDNKNSILYWISSLVEITNDGSIDLPSEFKNKKILYGIVTGICKDDKFSVTLVDKETGDTWSGWYMPCSLVKRIASITEIIDMFTDKSYEYFN